MDALLLARFYLATNVLLFLVWLLLIASRAIGRTSRPMAFASQLTLGYAACVVAVVSPALGLFATSDYLPRAAQVWSASTMSEVVTLPTADHRVTLAFTSDASSIGLDGVELALFGLLAAGLIVALARIVFGVVGVWRIIAASHPLRRYRSLRILAGDTVDVPFSFWMPGRHFIVVPSALLSTPHDLRIALRHEAQHHRQADTRVLYAFQFLLGACFWNPAAYAVVRLLRELQEFACDDAIVAANTPAEEYCSCLLRLAEQARAQRARALSMGMADNTGNSVFIRRIEVMMQRPAGYLKRSSVLAFAAAAVAMMSVTAAGLAATIKDRRVTVADAQRMAAVARANSTFPIVVNDSVVQELNRYLGTPDGRAFVRDSLTRMRQHHELISAKLVQYGLPTELLAVPLVESGYRNLPPNQQAGRGAGLWMFIPRTAQRYSLRVDSERDDRLNVAAETDAAMRMFVDLHRHFDDWGLALLAYNGGNALVEQAMRETGSRDVWNIVGSGYENDQDYMPRVMAAILIMRNPEFVE